MGLYSRVGQATFLLSQALKLVSQMRDDQYSTADAEETAQLRRTLLSLVHLADTEATVRLLEFCTQSSICFRQVIPKNNPEWGSSGLYLTASKHNPIAPGALLAKTRQKCCCR